MIEKLKEIIAAEKDGVTKDDFEISGDVKIEVRDEDGNVKDKQTHSI